MKNFLIPSVIALISLSASNAFAVDCTIAAQRDSTCLGSSSTYGSSPSHNRDLRSSFRGSNAHSLETITVSTSEVENSCISVPFIAWAYDPVSYKTPLPSFLAKTSSGYIGSGGKEYPLGYCGSDSDGSCTTWVPQNYPYLFLGNDHFVQCTGSLVSGSLSCPVSGSQAYVTTNPNSSVNFTASMIACKKATISQSIKVNGFPLYSWVNCANSRYCRFSLIYPSSSSDR